MAELVTNTNGAQYPSQDPRDSSLTQVVNDLDLRDLMIERGTSGLRRAGGYVREELLVELTGLAGIRKYKEMSDNSPVIGACLFAIQMLMRNVKWFVTPADTSDEAQRYADILSGMLFEDLDLPWSLMLSEILSFLPFGWSYFELVFKRRQGVHPPPHPDGSPGLPSKFNDGYLGLAKIAPRAQETLLRWEFDHTGSLLGMHQLDPWMGRQAYLPYEKCLLFRPTSYKNSPEGRSVLRTAYRPWYLLSHSENIEAITLERDGTGLPLIGTPPQWWLPTASPHEVAQLDMVKRVGRNMRQDEQACIVYPLIYDAAGNLLMKVELLASPGTKAVAADPVIQRHELRITQSLLCDMIFLGHEDVGSFALASSKSTTNAMSLGGYNTAIKDEVNGRLVPLIWRLNAFPEAYMPTVAHGDVETVDLTELARFILSFGRIYPMADLENHIRGMAGLPERENAENTPLPPAIQPTGGFGGHGGGSGLGTEALSTGQESGQVGIPDLDRALEPQSIG
jgi:hypothetical protein